MQLRRGGWQSEPWQRGSILPPSPPPREAVQQRCSAPGSAPGLDLLLLMNKHLLLQVKLGGIPVCNQTGAVRDSQGNLVLAALVARGGGGLGTLRMGPDSEGAAPAANSIPRQGTGPPRPRASHSSLRSSSSPGGSAGLDPAGCSSEGPVPRSSAAFCLHKPCSPLPDTHTFPIALLQHQCPVTSYHFQPGIHFSAKNGVVCY